MAKTPEQEKEWVLWTTAGYHAGIQKCKGRTPEDIFEAKLGATIEDMVGMETEAAGIYTLWGEASVFDMSVPSARETLLKDLLTYVEEMN